MHQPVMSRSQRRIEKKQTLLVLLLILVVAGVSFALGVMVGQKGETLPDQTASGAQEVPLPAATQVVPVPPTPEPEPIPELPRLTFYDDLPKGDQAPLGSGINLPPDGETPGAGAKAEVVVETAAPKPVASPVPKPKAAKPTVSPQGAFVVQVASFRTAADAAKLQKRLNQHDLTTSLERADLGQKGIWFRVLAGPYANRSAADQVVALLKTEERLSALVRKR